jgi:hypothetical protein
VVFGEDNQVGALGGGGFDEFGGSGKIGFGLEGLRLRLVRMFELFPDGEIGRDMLYSAVAHRQLCKPAPFYILRYPKYLHG